MSELPSLRRALADRSGPGCIAYLTVGDPADERLVSWARQLERGGCAALELGLPAPHARERGVLARSHERALTAAGPDRVDALFEELRDALSIPLIAVAHAPVDADDGWVEATVARAAGRASALLTVGLPVMSVPKLAARCQEAGLETVLSVFPDTPSRLRRFVYKHTTGCVYLARGRGPAGGAPSRPVDETCRTVVGETDLPVVVGFGIRGAAQVRAVCDAGASAAVVGSALVERVEQALEAGDADPGLESMMRELLGSGASRGA